MVSLPLQYNLNMETGPYDRPQHLLNIQPVYPINLNADWNLITRTIVPVLSQPAFTPAQERASGLGDIQFSAFFSPKQAVNQMLIQPFVNYNFPDAPGRYLSFSPIVTANWQAESGQQWTIPLGLSIGQILKVGQQPINLQAGYYYNVERPEEAPRYQLRLQVVFLFPK
jgi:hypothetical protein